MSVMLPLVQQAEIVLNQARLVETSSNACALTGKKTSSANKGLTIAEIIDNAGLDQTEAVKDVFRARLQQWAKSDYTLEDMPSRWWRGNEELFFNFSYYGVMEQAFVRRVVILHRDENARHRQEQIIASIAQNVASETGEAFFTNLAQHLVTILGLEYAAAAELLPGVDSSVQLLAFHSASSRHYLEKGRAYSIEGITGFAALAGGEDMYSSGVRRIFPEVGFFQALGIESYFAVPVWGEGSQQLGMLALMHTGEFSDVSFIRSVLNIFAIRASGEIERRRTRREKEQREQQQQIFIENNSSGMFVVDIDPPMPTTLPPPQQVQWLAEKSRFSECNQALLDLLGYDEKSTLIGRPLFGDLVSYDFATQARNFVSHDYQFRDALISLNSVKGDEVSLSTNISSVLKDGHLYQMLGVMTDISDRVRHSREMEFRARHDGLTGLPNRSYFLEKMDAVLSTSAPDERHALFILDLDGFKEVNDTLGHETGDFLLQQIGPRMAEVLVEVDAFFARLGGDEFAVLVENYESELAVTQLAETMMARVRSPFTIRELELVVGGSVGIALYPLNSDSVSSLMRCADVAMYQAKKQSKDFRVYSSESDHHSVRRLSLMMDIRNAVDNDELRLFYQPIVRLSDQQVVSFEALIRWQHPSLGMLPPGEFIPLIELTDMIVPVTWWVVETAIKQLQQWQARGWPYQIAVNVSTRNLIDAGFVGFIQRCLERYEVAGSLLAIEITESTLMADPDKARQVLQQVAALGVQISIDDYGTGYSSLAYLKSLPIHVLKIDRAFISQMLDDNQDQIIVNSTIQLAHNLGLAVIAEGIENVALIEGLQRLGCDKGQGFYLCKPIPIDELHAWLALYSRTLSGG